MTPAQMNHIAKVCPDTRTEMSGFLSRGVAVCIGPQDECGPDVPKFAIWVIEDPAFWIDCCATIEEAKTKSEELGLRVVRIVGH